MDKMKIESVDVTVQNIEKVASLLYNHITEVPRVEKAMNNDNFNCKQFNMFRNEIVVEENDNDWSQSI